MHGCILYICWMDNHAELWKICMQFIASLTHSFAHVQTCTCMYTHTHPQQLEKPKPHGLDLLQKPRVRSGLACSGPYKWSWKSRRGAWSIVGRLVPAMYGLIEEQVSEAQLVQKVILQSLVFAYPIWILSVHFVVELDTGETTWQKQTCPHLRMSLLCVIHQWSSWHVTFIWCEASSKDNCTDDDPAHHRRMSVCVLCSWTAPQFDYATCGNGARVSTSLAKSSWHPIAISELVQYSDWMSMIQFPKMVKMNFDECIIMDGKAMSCQLRH